MAATLGWSGAGAGAATPARPTTTVTVTIAAPIEEVFNYAVAEDVLPKVLRRYGPIPPVAGTEVLHGPWGRVGADRRVLLQGGGRLHEQITEFQPPTRFAYQIDAFERTPLRALASRGFGSWTLTDLGGRTRVDWTYTFEPRGCARGVVLAAFLHTFYRGFMRQALRIMTSELYRSGADDRPRRESRSPQEGANLHTSPVRLEHIAVPSTSGIASDQATAKRDGRQMARRIPG
jgi:uncharacterized protein YndB with AHSA1/START domain